MNADLVAVILLASVLNAAWNSVVKLQGDKLASMVQVTLAGSLLSLPFLWFFPAPSAGSWGWLLASIALHTAYHLFLPAAYAHGDLGRVYPIARGSAPLIVTAAAWLLAGETISLIGLLGVAALAMGVMLLATEKRGGSSRAVMLAFVTGGLIAAYTVVDALGARSSGSPLGFAAWLTVWDGVLTWLVVRVWQRARLRTISVAWRTGVLAGAMQVGAYWIAVWALSQAPMGQVSALRETSVLFAAFFSAFVLKEGPGLLRVASTILIFLGIAATKSSK
jgi:drug/metabolite transporter (DMT)-like permease